MADVCLLVFVGRKSHLGFLDEIAIIFLNWDCPFDYRLNYIVDKGFDLLLCHH